MNINIDCFVRFEGITSDLDPVIDEIADVLAKYGFGNPMTDDPDRTVVNSLIVVRETSVRQGPQGLEEFVQGLVPDALHITMPVIVEAEGSEQSGISSGEEAEAGRGFTGPNSEDQRQSPGADRPS